MNERDERKLRRKLEEWLVEGQLELISFEESQELHGVSPTSNLEIEDSLVSMSFSTKCKDCLTRPQGLW